MNDTPLPHHHLHFLSPQIDIDSIQKLSHSKVLIVGLGGLGSPVAMYLAAAGVGHLVLADSDTVEISNLQRQIVHDTFQIGQSKVHSALHKLQAIHPHLQITPIQQRLEGDLLDAQVKAVDVVADCSDNFTTRFALNAACVRHRKPLVSGAAIRFIGQVAVFLPSLPQSPCYRCLYPDIEEMAETCSQMGILAPLVGIIGSLQAVEIIKILLYFGQPLCGKLFLFDAYTTQWRILTLSKDVNCPVCNHTLSADVRL